VALIEILIGKGYEVSIYDPDVALARLHGSNRVYIDRTIPHIAGLMKEAIDTAIDDSEVVVVAKRSPEFAGALARLPNGKAVVDLVRALPRPSDQKGHHYEGICW
jgi:GDP-mannose 6-dehydrogenase